MRRIFITAPGHGIGRAMVGAFVSEGDRVAFCDVDVSRGEAVAAATGTRACDLAVAALRPRLMTVC